MYNRYIPNSGNTHRQDAQNAQTHTGGGEGVFGTGQQWFNRLGESLGLLGGGAKNGGIAGILKGFGLEELDSGDVLLLLILLLIFLEGDNTELVITLALMLLMGSEDNQKE